MKFVQKCYFIHFLSICQQCWYDLQFISPGCMCKKYMRVFTEGSAASTARRPSRATHFWGNTTQPSTPFRRDQRSRKTSSWWSVTTAESLSGRCTSPATSSPSMGRRSLSVISATKSSPQVKFCRGKTNLPNESSLWCLFYIISQVERRSLMNCQVDFDMPQPARGKNFSKIDFEFRPLFWK